MNQIRLPLRLLAAKFKELAMNTFKRVIGASILTFTYSLPAAAASLSGDYTCIFNRSFAGFNAINAANGGNPNSLVNGLIWVNFGSSTFDLKAIEVNRYDQVNAGTTSLPQSSGTVLQAPLGASGNRFKVTLKTGGSAVVLAAVRVSGGNALYAAYPYSEDPTVRFNIEPAYIICNRP